MTPYISDRVFTDYIHDHVAIPKVYSCIGWKTVDINSNYLHHIDMTQGIDYVFEYNGEIKTVQERFRESRYAMYSDFTIRYRRDQNIYSDRVMSEYYKMKADYFLYGITNCSKDNLSLCTDFQKVAIIDLKKVYKKLDMGDIIIRDNGRNTCKIENGRIICPVKYNRDRSSSFFPIEIAFLVQLWGNDMIVFNKGFE